ncbi:TPA: ead/Ea22-like family protein [Citrobacter freundii]
MSNINKQELRRTSDRDWFEDWFKREFHPDKTGPYIKDQLFFAVLAARAPLLDELEAAEKRIAEQREYYEGVIADGSRRIAELEARTVTLPQYRNSPDMHTKQFYEAIGFNQGLDIFIEALRAAGIGVKGE